MFKSALYLVLTIIFIFSFVYFIRSLNRSSGKKSNVLAIAFLVLDFINYFFFSSDFIDIGLELRLVDGVALLAAALLVTSLIITNLKRSREKNGFSKARYGIHI